MKARYVSGIVAAVLAISANCVSGVAWAGGLALSPCPPPRPATPYSFFQLGKTMGQDLRIGIVSWGEFVDFLRAYVVTATPAMYSQFRQGFLSGYGFDAVWVLEGGMNAARS